MKRLRVYLSSTFEDLKEYRAAVFAALERGGLDVARMEAYTAADERPLDLCLRDVAQSDIYVGLFAWRYGYEPPAEHGNPRGQSITDLEYRQAEGATLRKLLFFAHPDTQPGWPDRFKDEATGAGERGEKLKRFRAEVGTEKTGSFFRTPDELATLVLASIMRSGLSGRIYNVPPRAPGFVARPALTRSIVDALLGAAGGAPGASTLVQGPGGFGKTTLAIDVCHRAEVVDAFPDGLLWVTLGEQPDMAGKLSDLHVLASGNPPAVAGVEAIGQALAKALSGRRCLLIVDDAWRPQDLAPFLKLEGPRLLVTTRIRSLIEQSGQAHWPDVPVDEMEASEAAAILQRGLAPDAADGQALHQLAERLGCWPLLLELANARLLEENKSRPGQLAQCIARVTMLFERKGVLGFDRRDPNARNAAVANSVDVGLDRAEEMFAGLAQKAAELSVFPEDVAIPARVLADLWAMDEFDVEEECLRPLDDLSLLRWDRQAGAIRLHDMIRRALEARLAEPQAVHRRLTDAWKDAHHLPHEYAWRWFGWHCVRADDSARLQALLLDFDWLQAKLQATDIDALIGEFDLVQRSPQADLLQGALRLSAHVLGKNKSHLAAQLLARIPESETALRDQTVASAQTVREPWLRPVRQTLTSPGGPLLRTLEGHTDKVTAVAILPDGLSALSASDDKTLRLWDLTNGDVLRTFEGHELDVSGVAITPDGHRAVSASWDYTLRVWDITTGEALRTLEGHASAVLAVAITPDGRRALSASTDKTLKLWDLASGECLRTLEGHADEINAVAISPDGQRAVSASKDKTVKVWNLDSGETLQTLEGHTEAVTAVTISPDGLRAIAMSSDSTKVWDLEHGNEVQTLDRACSIFTAAAFAPDDHRAVTTGSNGTIRVWDLGRAEVLRTLDGHGSPITALALTPDGRRAVSASWDHTLKVWDLERGEAPGSRDASVSAVFNPLVVMPDGQRVICGGSPRMWNVEHGEMVSGSLPWRLGQAATALALSADGTRAISTGGMSSLWVWDSEALKTLGAPSEGANPLAPEPMQSAAPGLPGPGSATTEPLPPLPDPFGERHRGDDLFADLFSVEGSAPIVTPASPGERAKPNAWAPGLDPFADLGSADGTPSAPAKTHAADFDPFLDLFGETRRLDLPAAPPDRHELLLTLETETWVNGVAITPDGRLAVSANEDNSLVVWDLVRGAALHKLQGHGYWVVAAAITPDGQRVVSASWDRTLKIWALFSGELLRTLEGHTRPVLAVAITPDGLHAVSASADKTLKVWDLASGELVRTLEGHTHDVNSVALTLDGQRAVSGSDDRSVCVWDLARGEVIASFVGDSPVKATAVTHDGKSVMAADSAGRLHFLRLENAPSIQ
jgi:WD40 repeat protein